MRMRASVIFTALLVPAVVSLQAMDNAAVKNVKITSLVVGENAAPLVLGNKDSMATGASFRPPIQITLVAKTDSTNLRMGYAADQVIFNWEMDPQQLRVDGGPASGKHKAGAGSIPVDKYVTVKWIITAQKQLIYVDEQLRFEHEGDYSGINKPVKVFTHQSKISIKNFEVRPLAGR